MAYRRLLQTCAARFPAHADLQRLLGHGLHEFLFLSGGPRPCFRLRETGENATAKQLKGVTDLFKKHIFPHYRYRRRKDSAPSGVRSAAEGRSRGSKVHKQIEEWANNGAETMEQRWGAKSRADGRDRVMPMTRRFIEWAQRAQLRPVIAELIVCDAESGIGSAVDLIMMSQNDQLVLIELKTGLDNFAEHCTVLHDGPLGSERMQVLGGVVTDCPRDQAFVQLLAYRAMLERQFGVRIGYRDTQSGALYTCCYVVHLPHAAEVTAYALPEYMVAVQDEFWEHLVAKKKAAAQIKKDAAERRKRQKAAQIVQKAKAQRKSKAGERKMARQKAAARLMGSE